MIKIGTTSNRFFPTWVLALIAIVVFAQWILPLPSPLWLDETATHWIVKAGPSEIAARCAKWGNDESVLYMYIAWLAESLGGANEIALRLPSVIAMAGAVYCVYRLGCHLLNPQTGMLAAVIFLCSRTVLFAAVDARTYACALVSLAGAALLTLQWVAGGHFWRGIAGAILAATTLYLHPLFAFGLVPFGVYAAFHLRNTTRLRQIQGLALGAITLTLTLPLVAQFFWLVRNARMVSFATRPTPADLMHRLVPAELIPAVLCAIALWRFGYARRSAAPPTKPDTLLLIVSWWLIPIVMNFAISMVSASQIFVPRYMLAAAPGFALTCGWLLQALGPKAAQMAVVAMALVASVAPFSRLHGEDLRSPLARVNAEVAGRDIPVGVASGYRESMPPDRYPDLTPDGYLLSPLSMYPVRGKIIPLPFGIDLNSAKLIETSALDALTEKDEFWLVARAGSNLPLWLEDRLRPAGWNASTYPEFTSWQVYHLRRTRAATPTHTAPFP